MLYSEGWPGSLAVRGKGAAGLPRPAAQPVGRAELAPVARPVTGSGSCAPTLFPGISRGVLGQEGSRGGPTDWPFPGGALSRCPQTGQAGWASSLYCPAAQKTGLARDSAGLPRMQTPRRACHQCPTGTARLPDSWDNSPCISETKRHAVGSLQGVVGRNGGGRPRTMN